MAFANSVVAFANSVDNYFVMRNLLSLVVINLFGNYFVMRNSVVMLNLAVIVGCCSSYLNFFKFYY